MAATGRNIQGLKHLLDLQLLIPVLHFPGPGGNRSKYFRYIIYSNFCTGNGLNLIAQFLLYHSALPFIAAKFSKPAGNCYINNMQGLQQGK